VRGPLRGRCRQDHFANAFDISHDLVIPEAQHAIAVINEPPVSDNVTLVRGVLTTVNFYDEPPFAADEIDDVGSDRFLPYELETDKRSGAKVFPKPSFSVG